MKISPVPEQKDRRKIIYWVAGALSAVMFWRYLPKKSEEKEEPVKMLTEDGRLVEVDLKHLKGERKKLKPDEFHSWVKRKK